jgi:DNA-binding transcriptional MerR regulator
MAGASSDRSRRVSEKSEGAFRTIGEVAESLDLPQHVLRFWETKFREIEPVKRAGGRRYYRPRDVELLAAIRHLLYGKGYTIKGVQRILKEQGARAVIEGARPSEREIETEPPFPKPPAVEAGGGAEPETAAFVASSKAPVEPPALGLSAQAQSDAPPTATRLSDENRRRLQQALDEIAECKRLLALTRR